MTCGGEFEFGFEIYWNRDSRVKHKLMLRRGTNRTADRWGRWPTIAQGTLAREACVAEEDLVLNAAERVFADLADPQAILKSQGKDWKSPLWNALTDVGLLTAWVPEELGGHGLSLREGLGVVRAAGRAALAVPLVETMLAGWIAGRAGLALPNGASTVVVAGCRADVRIDEDGSIRAHARGVPFAAESVSIVLVTGDTRGSRVAVVPAQDCRFTPGRNLAGDASDEVDIEVSGAKWGGAGASCADHALFLATTCRALQIGGALQAALDLSVEYAKERVAFEKPIARFQAVQQNLARLAGEVAAAVAASESAADTLATGDADDAQRLLEVASAKVRCGEAAETGAGIAHQVFGAIGVTEEHVLHRFTLRALSWRDDFGSEAAWARRLGERVSAGSGTDLWHLLATR